MEFKKKKKQLSGCSMAIPQRTGCVQAGWMEMKNQFISPRSQTGKLEYSFPSMQLFKSMFETTNCQNWSFL